MGFVINAYPFSIEILLTSKSVKNLTKIGMIIKMVDEISETIIDILNCFFLW